jgi:hypothetical protein
VSLILFHRVAAWTAGASTVKTGLLAFGLLLFPTLLMGSTLPLLMTYVVRSKRNVQRLAGLFALDAFAGGFVVNAFIVWLMRIWR